MRFTRPEPWGFIRYVPEVDEFHGFVRQVAMAPIVSAPLSAGCLVTGACNLRCLFCYGNFEALPPKAAELDSAEWARVFARLRGLGLMRVDLSGGEPTLRRDIYTLAQSAQNTGLAVVLSTNGTCETPINRLVPPGVRLHVSFDAGIAEWHEASRRGKSLPLPRAGLLERAIRFCDSAIQAGRTVRAMTCIGPHNEECLIALGERLAALGVAEWNVSRILRAGRAIEHYKERWLVDDSRVRQQVLQMRAAFPWIRIRYSDRTGVSSYFLLVLPDGTLATQAVDERDKIRLGQVTESTLETLVAHPEFDLPAHGRKWLAVLSVEELAVLAAA